MTKHKKGLFLLCFFLIIIGIQPFYINKNAQFNNYSLKYPRSAEQWLPPIKIGQFNDGGTAYDVYILGNYAYVADGNDGLEIIDISDPSAPIEIGQFDVGYSSYHNLFILDNYAYVGDGYDLEIIDISNPSIPKEFIRFYCHGPVHDVYVSGNYAYVARNYMGLEIIDISNLSFPIAVSQFDDGGCSEGVYISGNYAYVADSSDGLEIFDISEPSNPSKVGQFYDFGSATDVYISGKYAYVADSSDGLEIIDISKPSTPSKVGQYKDGGYAVGVYVSGNYAYVADSGDGLEIIDISDPSTPTELGQFNDGGFAYNVYGSDLYAYVADEYGGLEIIDIGKDTDSDAMSDGWEILYNLNPNNASDAYEDPDSDGLENYEEYNHQTNPRNPDTDGDELIDYEEVYIHNTDPNNPDTDSDELTDYEEVYTHNTDPNNPDTDGDKLTDYEEIYIYNTDPNNLDTDEDTMSDGWEIQNNLNPNNASDANEDPDSDGLENYEEYNYQTDPNNPDTDDDKLTDYEEIYTYNTDPNNPDTDDDELTDYEEIYTYNTDPKNFDTDDDLMSDGWEILYNLNPNNALDAYEDPDSDGLKNHEEYNYQTDPNTFDTDGDELTDYEELYIHNTDPNKYDTDGDMISDGWEILCGLDPKDGSDDIWYEYSKLWSSNKIKGTFQTSYNNSFYVYGYPKQALLKIIVWYWMEIYNDNPKIRITIFDSNGSKVIDQTITIYCTSIWQCYEYGRKILHIESPGFYTIKFSATKSRDYHFTIQQSKYWSNSLYLVDFMANVSKGSVPLSVQFIDTSKSFSGIASWDWDFGDGTYSTQKNPVHTYRYPGTYRVILTVTDNNGESNFKIMEIDVKKESPSITINSPNNNRGFANIAPNFNLSVIDYDSIWYTLDNGVTNTTCGTLGQIDPTLWNDLIDGTYTLRFYANSSAGFISTAAISIYKDTTKPIINIIEPTSGNEYTIIPLYEIVVTEVNLDSLWYMMDNGILNIPITNYIGIIDENIWSALPYGPVTITFYANDTVGNLGFSSVIVYKNRPNITPSIPGFYPILISTVLFIGIIRLIWRQKHRWLFLYHLML